MPRTRRPPVDREPHDWWLGACKFITKPVDFDVLNAVARRRSVERTSVGERLLRIEPLRSGARERRSGFGA
jgi:hypothetical protein